MTEQEHARIWRWFRDRMVRGELSEPPGLSALQEKLEAEGRGTPTAEEMDEYFLAACKAEGR